MRVSIVWLYLSVCRYGIHVHDWLFDYGQNISDEAPGCQCSCTFCLLFYCTDRLHGSDGSCAYAFFLHSLLNVELSSNHFYKSLKKKTYKLSVLCSLSFDLSCSKPFFRLQSSKVLLLPLSTLYRNWARRLAFTLLSLVNYPLALHIHVCQVRELELNVHQSMLTTGNGIWPSEDYFFGHFQLSLCRCKCKLVNLYWNFTNSVFGVRFIEWRLVM